MAVGAKVTLRNKRMYNFLEKLIVISLPRVKDFRGFHGMVLMGAGITPLGSMSS